jgi:polyisoprenoid-binding protein YceI
MKRTYFAIALLTIASPAWAQQDAASPQPQPVPAQSGIVNLGPINSRIDFVGIHEGEKPDPRKGGFSKFIGRVQLDPSGNVQAVDFDFETASLWTEIPKLTAHLKSPDFFDVRQHPKAKFRTTSIGPGKEPGTFAVVGKFSLLGVTKDLTIPAKITVTQQGVTVVSSFKLDRTQFGMNYGEGQVQKIVEISVAVGIPTTAGNKN